jgi:prepilin-type N-terminal cleavage/methylation domain-containing protein
MSSRARVANANGFSLFEMMLVVSLLGIFFGAVYETAIVALRAVHAADGREDLRQQLAHALELLTREAALASNVDQAQDQRFQIDADIDGDGGNETNINYRLQSGALERVHSGDTSYLVRGVTSLDFDYVDENNAAMSTPVGSSDRDDIRVMQVTITAVSGAESISLTSAAYLRNNS